jgi:hypothetical protein
VKNTCKALLILLFSVYGFCVTAQQIIHIENKRLAAVDSGFTGNISVQANFIQNVNNIFQNRNYIQLQYTQNKHSVLSLSNQNLSIVNKERIINDGYQHLRYNYKYNKLVTYEAFVQFQYNKIILIDFQSLIWNRTPL